MSITATKAVFIAMAWLSSVCVGAPSGLKPSTIDSLNAQNHNGRVLSASELKVIEQRRLSRQGKLKAMCKVDQYKSVNQCDRELFKQVRDCHQSDECTAVIDECGHWSPINKKFAALHNDLNAEIYIGTTPCRWRGPSAVEGNRPTFACIEGECK